MCIFRTFLRLGSLIQEKFADMKVSCNMCGKLHDGCPAHRLPHRNTNPWFCEKCMVVYYGRYTEPIRVRELEKNVREKKKQKD